MIKPKSKNIDHILGVILQMMLEVGKNEQGKINLGNIVYRGNEKDDVLILNDVFTWLESLGGKLDIKKSKRRKRIKDSESEKYIELKTENYTGKNLLEILKPGFENFTGLELHDIFLSNYPQIIPLIEGDIKDLIDRFINGELINNVSYSTAKKLYYKRLLAHIELHENEEYAGTHIFIGSGSFTGIKDFPYVLMFCIFSELGYVSIDKYSNFISYDYRSYNGNYLGIYLEIELPLLEILRRHLVLEEYILETILDDKYKELRLKGKQATFFIERTIEYSDDAHLVELRDKYPHSEITAKNYNGKITKYEVKEKIRINANE